MGKLSKPGIEVPYDLLDTAADAAEMDVDRVGRMLPITLGRGVPRNPQFINHGVIELAGTIFKGMHANGWTTYSGEKHPDVSDKNAFRGDKEYLKLAVKELEEAGVSAGPMNVVTGSQGGQELVTAILQTLHKEEDGEIRFGSTDRTFNRTKDNMADMSAYRLEGIEQDHTTGELNLDDVSNFFATGKSVGTLYLVPWGGNPDGLDIPMDNLIKVLEAAQDSGGKVVLDGAYLRLNFPGVENHDLSKIEGFIKNGTAYLACTATKEGGERGPAYAVGSSDMMSKVLRKLSNQRLSPDYNKQRTHVYATKLGVEDNVKSLLNFRNEEITPALAEQFGSIKSILDASGVPLSADVKTGYNVSILFPRDASEEDAARFFVKLRTYGVVTAGLDAFNVLPHAKNQQKGFRFPFGGYSPEECKIASTIIAKAYEETWG